MSPKRPYVGVVLLPEGSPRPLAVVVGSKDAYAKKKIPKWKRSLRPSKKKVTLAPA